MNGCKLYERLIKEHPDYCKRKSPWALKVSCEYIEGNMTMHQLYLKYGVFPNVISKVWKEIAKLLGVELKRKSMKQY